MTMKALLTAVLLLSAVPAYSLDYRSESLEICFQNETTQNSYLYPTFATSLGKTCMLKDRAMISESGIDLFKEAMFTDDVVTWPGFIQALQESKRQGCSL